MKIEATSRERKKCISFKESDTIVSLEKSIHHGKFSVETQRKRERGRKEEAEDKISGVVDTEEKEEGTEKKPIKEKLWKKMMILLLVIMAVRIIQ